MIYSVQYKEMFQTKRIEERYSGSMGGEDPPKWSGKDGPQQSNMEFVYPYGCTLELEHPAVPLLSTGSVCYPTKVCIAALSTDMTMSAKQARGIPAAHGSSVSKGRVMVVGSAHMFGDSWLDKEDNAAVMRYGAHQSSQTGQASIHLLDLFRTCLNNCFCVSKSSACFGDSCSHETQFHSL